MFRRRGTGKDDFTMIDGINRGGGPLGPFTARNQPARVTGAGASDTARPLRPVAEAGTTARRRGLVAELAKAPPVNSVRVAQLQAEIASGRFKVDADGIAAAMLRLDRGRP
jgi:flagellar biosynthesis anti-sigma factor FlgM